VTGWAATNTLREPRCVHCGHHHYGERDEDGVQWCDTAICGDGCCHCACYTPVYRDGPGLLAALRAVREGA
jgi:hypothetical protein